MKILLTGARAPTALDLARRCHAAGHTVVLADSLRFGMAMFSNVASKTVVLPRPAESPQTYIAAVCRLIEEEKIDLLIPTCEEVFFLSRFKDLLPCRLLSDDFQKLTTIHDKFKFSQIAGNDFAKTPETYRVENADQLLPYKDHCKEWVFKPVFSRFASRTLVSPSKAELSRVLPTVDDPWVVQRRIYGQEYSTYSIARDGRLLAHACYKSLYRAGKGSGIYFQPVTHAAIQNFAQAFVEQLGYSGQIGLDLIESADETLFALEGNPRATSGVHLFAATDPVVDIITEASDSFLRPGHQIPLMVEFAMPIWGIADAVRQRRCFAFAGDVFRARCTSFKWRDALPSLALPVSLLELAWVAIRERQSLIQASTFDIEWNGEVL